MDDFDLPDFGAPDFCAEEDDYRAHLVPVHVYVYQVQTGTWKRLVDEDADLVRADDCCRFRRATIDAVATLESDAPRILTYYGILDETILALLRRAIDAQEDPVTLESIPF